MDKFTNKIGKFDKRKYTDKTKNDIYNLIKENITIKIDGDRGYIDETADISLDGFEELTDVLYNYVQQEKARQETLTLEQVKLNTAIGTINIKTINERIENLNEKYKI
jgi:LPS O-antigen subunit length determinant protein (WzzB/FepE family)